MDHETGDVPAARVGADEVAVRDNPDRGRYEAYVGSVLAGYADYHSQPGLVTVLHTEIDTAFEGRGGIGARPPDARRHSKQGRERARGLPVRARVPATPSRVLRRGVEAVTATPGVAARALGRDECSRLAFSTSITLLAAAGSRRALGARG